MGLIKKECKKDLASLGRVHEKKLHGLTHFLGSLKILANRYTIESFPAIEKHRVEPHCHLNRKVLKKKKKKEEDEMDHQFPCPET